MTHRLAGPYGLLLLAVLQWGCTHSMRVTNVDDYRYQANVERPLHLGVRNNAGTEDGRLLAESVARALRQHPSIADVEILGERDPESDVDAIVTLNPYSSYEGSPWNFLIT